MLEECKTVVEGGDVGAVPVADGLRPRLPLASEFVTAEIVSDYLGEGNEIEGDIPAAGRPYSHAARSPELGQDQCVQLLPPERLVSREYVSAIRVAMARINALDHPNLIRVTAFWESESPDFYVEESFGLVDVAGLVAQRGGLVPAEALFLLDQVEGGLRQAEQLGIGVVGVSPRDLIVKFTDDSRAGDDPGIEELQGRDLMEWPGFRVKLRTHPTAVHLLQPGRFEEFGLGSGRLAADFALLARFMIREELRTPHLDRFLADVIDGGSQKGFWSRVDVLDRLRVLSAVDSPSAEFRRGRISESDGACSRGVTRDGSPDSPCLVWEVPSPGTERRQAGSICLPTKRFSEPEMLS